MSFVGLVTLLLCQFFFLIQWRKMYKFGKNIYRETKKGNRMKTGLIGHMIGHTGECV